MAVKLVGVTKEKGRLRRPYKAVIKIHGKTRHLGYFSTEEAAHKAFLDALADLDTSKNK